MNLAGEWYTAGSGRRVKPKSVTAEQHAADRAAGWATLMQHSRAAGVFDRSASRADFTTATAESVPTAGARARQASNGDGGKHGGCV